MNRTALVSGFLKSTPVLAVVGIAFALLAPLGCTDSNTSEDCPAKDSLCLTKEQFLAKGDTIFQNNCAGCHGTDGMGGDGGHAGNVPPLTNSDFFMAERLRPVRIVLRGLPNLVDTATTITVNGQQYQNIMPAILADYSNLEIAAVLSFVRDSLNGGADLITVKEVKSVRDTLYVQQ